MIATRAAADETALQELAHVLTHRLGGLVSGIEGYADLLRDTLGTREQRECALRIVEGTVRIERVLAELRHFSRPVVPSPVPLTGAEVVGGVLAALDEDDRRRVEAVRPVAVGLSADPRLVRQALLVMLQNALESGPGAVRLVVAADAPEGGVRIDVLSEGVMSDEAARQAFTPFYTTKAQNLGVGLAIARRIAEAHGGTLDLAANDAAAGVVFRLVLPAEASARRAESGAAVRADATFADVL